MQAMHLKLLFVFLSSLCLIIDSSNESTSTEKCYFINQQSKERWKLVWQDNFQSDDVLKENWLIGDGDCRAWDYQKSCSIKENVKLLDGCLVMSAKEEKYGKKNFTGAMLTTKWVFGHNRFEVRAALSEDNVRSIFSTTSSFWKRDGFFIMNQFDNFIRSFYVVVFPNNVRVSKDNSKTYLDYSLFHLYGMEWSENEVKFFVDDHYSEPILLNATPGYYQRHQIRLTQGVFDDNKPILENHIWKCPLLILDYVRVYTKVNPKFGLKLELCEEQNDVDQSSKKQRELVNSLCTFQTFPESLLPNKSKIDTSNGYSWEPCGGSWEQYQDEKCFQILDDSTYSFESAIEKCASLEDMSTLAIIESEKEQNFVSNFLFKIHKKVDNFWVGAKYSNTSNSFKWLENSELSFTNWHSNHPSKMGLNNSCVQMQAEEGLSGKWQNEPCETRNAVVCQKMQLWPIEQLQKSFLNARRKISKLENEIEVLKKNRG